MEAFLSFILITILVVYLLGWLGRLLLRRWIQRKQREFAERFGEGAGGTYYKQYTWGGTGGSQSREPEKKEGEVKIQQTIRTEKKVSGRVGDYVEYEEVDTVSEEKIE